MFLAIYEGPIEVVTGLLIALIAIALVFAVLLIIIGSINILKLAGNKSTVEVKEEVKKPAPAVAKNTESKDEDMMVAALVATIDYSNETKKDVKLVSIKQIG